MPKNLPVEKILGTKDAEVYVCNPSGTIRTQIVATLKEVGFKNITGLGELSDLVSLLGDETKGGLRFGWVLTTLQADGKVNALQVGKLLEKEPALRNYTWSLILNADEIHTLPLAIETSLMSWHTSESLAQGNSIKTELDNLFSVVEKLHHKFELISLSYAREFLKQTGSFENMLKLASVLVELEPDNSYLLSRYAEALALNNDTTQAKKVAKQVSWSDSAEVDFLQQITDKDGNKLFSGDEHTALSTGKISQMELFGINRCIIIEPDESVRSHLKKALESLGIKEFEEFDNGLDAWEAIKSNHAGTMVVTEWKLPKLSGMALLQRIHQANLHDIPVIVSSALLGPEDKGLLEELGNAELLPKPLTMDSLETSIKSAIREESMPSSFKGVVRKVRNLLKKNQINEASSLWTTSTAKMLTPELWRHLIASEILLAKGELEEAYAEALAAGTLGAKGAYFYNHLGKVAFSLGDFDNSASHFQKANADVSINVERLTDLAAVELHRGNIDQAENATSGASEIDANNPKVIETKAMVAIEKNDPERASAAMSQLEDLMNIVAHLNNRAVSMAWTGNHEKGIALYRDALTAAPKNKSVGQKVFTPFVVYNLALALARSGDLEGAEKTAAELDPLAIASIDERLSLKVGGFLKRAREAIKSGKKLSIETPKTSDLVKKRLQKAQAKAEKIADASERIIKDLKVLGSIDYRALKLVEKSIRIGSGKKS